MDPILPTRLISTKEASKKFGYTPDHLARLARAGHIEALRVGRAWLVDTDSLSDFVLAQSEHKQVQARKLARARGVEYRASKVAALSKVSVSTYTPRYIEVSRRIEEPDIPEPTLLSQFAAFSLASVVLASAAALSNSDMMHRLGGSVSILSEEFLVGFKATFGTIPNKITSSITETRIQIETQRAQVTTLQVEVFGGEKFEPVTLVSLPPLEKMASVGVQNDKKVYIPNESATRPQEGHKTVLESFVSLGQGIIDIKEMIIELHERMIYGIVDTAPKTARVAFLTIEGIGETLFDATAKTPRLLASVLEVLYGSDRQDR